MSRQVQFRRGTTAQHAVFTGAQGEITVDTDKKVPVVHDGSTVGGLPAARADQVLAMANNLSDLGNAALARDNLGVFGKDDSYNLAQARRAAAGIYFNGVFNNQRLYASLGSYSIGTNPFALRIVFRMADSAIFVAPCNLAQVTSSATALSAQSVLVSFTSTALRITFYGATTSDYVYYEVAGFVAAYQGKFVELVIRRLGNTLAVYANGVALTLSTPVTYGTPPSVASSILSNFLVIGSGFTRSFVGSVYAVTLFNYALTAAQVVSLARDGVSPADMWASDAELITGATDRDFSGANNWANVSLSSFDKSADLSLVASGTNQSCNLNSSFLGALTPGLRYQISADVANLSGSFSFRGSLLGTLGTISNIGRFSSTFVLVSSSFGNLEVLSGGSGSVDLDNLTLKLAGAVVDLNFAEAVYFQVPDRSTNNFHAQVAASPSLFNGSRRGQLRGRTNTNGNQQLVGTGCIPTNARILAIVVKSDGSGTPTNAINIGEVSGGLQISSGVAVVPGRNEVEMFDSRYSTTGNIRINANGTSNLDITVLYELVD
jgi:hypothetical protein